MDLKEKRNLSEDTNSLCPKFPYIELSEGWKCIKTEGIGPFVTHAVFKNPEGKLFFWESRYHRKHHFKLDSSVGSTWWAPGAVGWWTGILFVIGSFLFALATVPGYINLVGSHYDNITFFIGSLFFTSAAFLQYLDTVNAPHHIFDSVKEKFRLITWEPKRIDWWVTVVQFVGTIFFNISTANAIRSNLSVSIRDHIVWSPDVYGSICFLIACLLAWWEVSHSLWSLKPNKFSWWIAALNLTGAIAFGASAAAAFILPTTGLPKNELIMNLGTFIGAVCFLIGGLLLLPERTKEERECEKED